MSGLTVTGPHRIIDRERQRRRAADVSKVLNEIVYQVPPESIDHKTSSVPSPTSGWRQILDHPKSLYTTASDRTYGSVLGCHGSGGRTKQQMEINEREICVDQWPPTGRVLGNGLVEELGWVTGRYRSPIICTTKSVRTII